MRTRSSSNQVGETSTNPNPKGRNCRRSKQRVELFSLEESPVVTMADQRTMTELLRAPTEGYAEAIFIPPILTEHFELKHSLINLAWNRFKDLLRACPHHGFTELHQLDTFYNGLNPSDQDSLNSVAGGNLLESSAQDVLKIIENKSKVRNSRNKPIVSQAKASNVDSSEIASAVASVVTSAMTTMFKQHQVTPATASIKAIEESCVSCGDAHSYRQCPATDGNTFSSYQDNIQGYVSAAAVYYNQGNTGYRPQRGNRSYQASIQQTQVVTSSDLENFKKTNEANMQAIRNHINNLKSELRSEMQSTMQNKNNAFKNKLTNDIKNMMASFFQINTASTSSLGPLPSNTIANLKGELKAITTRSGIVLDGPFVPMPLPLINSEEDERAKYMLTDPDLAEYTINVPPPLYLKMLKALLSNKEKLLELANTPLNENCSAVILKKLPEKLGDPGKFLISCGFSELKCKALADLGRFTFPTDFVIVDYESDPRVPLILGRPFLRTARALIDVYGEELILRNSDERLILNMKHNTSSYSNKPQRESIHMIDIYNISYEDYLEDLFANKKITNHLSGNPTFSLEPDTLTSDLTSPEVKDDIFDPEGDIVLIEKFLNLDSTKDLPPSYNINPLSGSTTSSSSSLTTSEISDYSLEEFADELALIESFPPGNDDMTPEYVIREIEYLLNRDPLAEYSLNNDLIYTILEMFTDEHTLDYSSLLRYDDTNDNLFDLKTNNDEWGKRLYDDPFDSKENKIKDSKLLIDELDSPGLRQRFNPCILVHENLYEVTNRVALDKNVKKRSSSNASLILEDYNPPLSDHELPFHIEILGSGTLLSFLSENDEKVFNPGFSFLKEFIHFYRNYLIGTLKVSNSLIFLKPDGYFFLLLWRGHPCFGCSMSPFVSPMNNSIRETGQA
nr:hypothetical protein [Tanacetum cinerariifolium]